MKNLSAVILFLLAFSTIAWSRDGVKIKNLSGINPYMVKAYAGIADSVKLTGDAADNFDWSSLGVGMGMDFGGYGVNYIAYVQKNIGIFAGAGWAVSKIGYNVGIKARLTPGKTGSIVTPYALAMYGYNAGVTVAGSNVYDAIFYGFTVGVGADFRFKGQTKTFWTLGLFLPFRGGEYDSHVDYLTNSQHVEYTNRVGKIGCSIGYHWIIPAKKWY